MWTPEDAQRLKQGTLLQTPREEEALKKIPPLLKKGPKDHSIYLKDYFQLFVDDVHGSTAG